MSCASILECQISYAQTQVLAELVDTVIVKRRTALQSDGAGGLMPSSGDGWSTIATIAGLLAPSRLSPTEQPIGTQINAPVRFNVYVEHGANVRAEDRLIIDSRTFEVEGISKTAVRAILDRIYAVELQK